jgi:ATP-binding cassette, subfamily B, multidrug efflux pump
MSNPAPSLNSASTEQRNRVSDWRLFLNIVPYAYPHRRTLIVAGLLLLPLALAGAIQPILVGQAISLLRQEPGTWAWLSKQALTTGLDILSGLLLLTVVLRFSLQSYQGYLVQDVGQRLTAEIRNQLFTHVTSLSSGFFDRTPVGRLITRLTSDVEALGDVFATGAVGIISDLFAIVMIVAFMFALDWKLALLLLLLLLPVTAVIIYFQHQYRQANYKARDELSSLNSMLQENISGIGVVQLFRREQFNAELFRHTNQRYIKEVDKTIYYDSAVSATLEWIGFIAVAGVVGLGGWLISKDAADLGTLSSFILFAQRLFDPLRQLAEKFTAIQAGFTAVERISNLMAEPIEIRDPEQPKRLPTLDTATLGLTPESTPVQFGEVQFEDVWFAYKDQDYVLQGLSFTVRPGEKVALVGPTGAGKSSIIRLLCRLYEPSRGRILVDGVDIRDLPQTELRQHVGVILQDGFLFAGDVKSNIALGETYSLSEIIRAAEQTNVASFIEQLPQGYDTPLRERGMNLSGGQRQLLAFARAAIRTPRILVLDEATASLDVGTEALIQTALEELLLDRTAIIIAHRLSTIRNVDRILVLKRGQLIESGSHEELIDQAGVYASLYRLQMLGQVLA